MSLKTGDQFRFGPFEVDALARTVRRQGVRLTLHRRAFDVLLYFLQNPGRVLSKEELLKSLWTDAVVDENSLLQSISALRRALEEKPGENSYIATLQGRGYQFISPVEIISTEEASPAPPAAEVNASAITRFASEKRTIRASIVTEETEIRASPQSWNRTLRWMAAGLLLAVISVAVYFAWQRLRLSPPPVLVVLTDFENNTGDPAFDGMLNRVLAIDLEQSPFLSLLSRSKIRETLTQMRRSRDEPLNSAVAREICERNDAQAVLHGTISRIGSDYLLILDAEGCASGQQLGGYKGQVSSKEELMSALDKAAGRVRQRLGESNATRERFQKPILQASTSSLDALRAFTEGQESFDRGDLKSAKGLFERAVALDPNFASAYKALASCYYDLNDPAQAAVLYKKAFDLRERTTERERLSIEILYYGGGIANYEEAIRSLKVFLQIYPNDSSNWGNLCNLYTQLGEYSLAIDAGQHAFRLDPRSSFAAEVLARAYKRANRFGEAKAVANASIASGRERWGTHSILFQIAFAERDAAGIKSEGEWGLTHNHVDLSLDDLGFAAATGGKLREAEDDFLRASNAALRSGDKEGSNGVLVDLAHALIDLEEPARAAAILKKIEGDTIDAEGVAFAKAEAGDAAAAEGLIAASGSVGDRNTIRVYCDVPRLRALLALSARKPSEAVHLLEPARIYQLRDFGIPYLRARAKTEAGMLDAAAQDYRLILNNQGVDPISPLYSLSHLRLARVLAMQRKLNDARDEYRAFFAAWKDADTDLPLFIQARREYEALSAGGT